MCYMKLLYPKTWKKHTFTIEEVLLSHMFIQPTFLCNWNQHNVSLRQTNHLWHRLDNRIYRITRHHKPLEISTVYRLLSNHSASQNTGDFDGMPASTISICITNRLRYRRITVFYRLTRHHKPLGISTITWHLPYHSASQTTWDIDG